MAKMVVCRICNKEYKVLTHAHLRLHGYSVKAYATKFGGPMVSQDTSLKLSVAGKGKKLGKSNPAVRPEVRKQISESVSKRWKEGVYKERINGMLGVCGKLHFGYKPQNHTLRYLSEYEYVDFLSKFEDVSICSRCGKSGGLINVHHIDEDRTNFLPSNLEPLCVPCHTSFHYSLQKRPFLVVGKIFKFDAAHRLPNYDGPCSRYHGHEYKLEVQVKRRVDTKTNMVMDFSKLKDKVKESVINRFDHYSLNAFFKNPTAESMIKSIWEILMFESQIKGLHQLILWETSDSYCKITDKMFLSIFESDIEPYIQKWGR